MKILLDIRVTVTFQGAFQPSAGLSYWKIGTRQINVYEMTTHYTSCQQCRTVWNSVEQCQQCQQCQQL